MLPIILFLEAESITGVALMLGGGLDMRWKTQLLPLINDDCLDCIGKVERNKKKDSGNEEECMTHDWANAHPREKTVCGDYGITELYYEECSNDIGFNLKKITAANWTTCALNDTCARDCVHNYVTRDRSTDCGRGTTEERLCVDYGIIHAFEPQACSLRRDGHSQIEEYASRMKRECGVHDPLPPTSISEQPSTTESTGLGEEVLVPIIAGPILVVIVIIVVAWYIKLRKGRLKAVKDLRMRSQGVNNYGLKFDRQQSEGHQLGTNNFLQAFGLDQCSAEIQDMVRERRISLENMDVLEEVGRGQFGVIRKAKYFTNAERTHHILTAVKIIRNQNSERYEEEVKSLLREAYIMSQFDHINVLNLIGVIWESSEPPVVVCPYMGKGSLLDLVKKSELRFSPTDLMNFVAQIAAGLDYLERLKFVHRDIALRNCLVSDLYIVKISDFGLTRDVYETRIYECSDVTEKRLPWKWLAPECIKQGSFTHKSDVWSFGVTIWELYTDGSSPYAAIGNLSVLQDCLETGYRLSKPDKLSQQLYDLMRLMWNRHPEKRPSFAALLSTIKQLEKNQGPPEEYSYTVEPGRLRDSVYTEEYYMHSQSGEHRISQLYADSPIWLTPEPTSEPDIYY